MQDNSHLMKICHQKYASDIEKKFSSSAVKLPHRSTNLKDFSDRLLKEDLEETHGDPYKLLKWCQLSTTYIPTSILIRRNKSLSSCHL